MTASEISGTLLGAGYQPAGTYSFKKHENGHLHEVKVGYHRRSDAVESISWIYRWNGESAERDGLHRSLVDRYGEDTCSGSVWSIDEASGKKVETPTNHNCRWILTEDGRSEQLTVGGASTYVISVVHASDGPILK